MWGRYTRFHTLAYGTPSQIVALVAHFYVNIAMEIEPKNLDIPLYKINWSPLWIALGCIGAAAVTIRASRLSQWLTVLIVLGPAFWVAFGGPSFIHRWQNNSVPLLRGSVFALRIGFLLMVFWYVVPYIVALLDGMFHAEGG